MMQLKWRGNTIYQYSWRRLLYAFCFLLFCIIDQRSKTCSPLDGWRETFQNLLGVGMAAIIMSHYRWADFRKWRRAYIIWSIAGAVGGAAALFWGAEHSIFLNAWVVAVIDVFLFGYIVIHTFISVVLEKQCPKLDKKFSCLWLAMMILMMVSRSTYIWPFCYLVMFGCFYLTDYSKEEQEDLFQGMLDGIILGFFVMQGWCFVFRPYDYENIRYQGMYSNSNWASLFYVEALAAVLAKILYVTKKECSKWTKFFYWLGAGLVLAFEFMTIGRTGWLTSIVLVLVFLWAMKQNPLLKKVWKNILTLILCFVVAFPLCFGASRYFPPMFHHPVWFWGEWSENRVHSWDAWDSDKYVDIDEFMEHALWRIYRSISDLLQKTPLSIHVEAAETFSEEKTFEENTSPVLTYKADGSGFSTRRTIYEYYAVRLNWVGHPYEEQGFQLTPTYWIGHAHNIFLQYGTDFGIPVMVIFICLVVWGSMKWLQNFKRHRGIQHMTALLFGLIPVVFGMLEYSWGVGSLSISMLYIVWRNALCSRQKACKES